MDSQFLRSLLLLLLCAPLILTAAMQLHHIHDPTHVHSPALPPPSLFVFGASMIDSGTNAIAMPRRSNAEFDPYGSDYFRRPVGRWSNGRNFMDFITQSLGFGFLDPFVKSIHSDFTHGVNFASSGSTAQNTSSTVANSGGLFSLLVQVEQFREYQSTILSVHQGTRESSKAKKQFSNSIYFFETAHNDYIKAGLDSDHSNVVKVVLAHMMQAFEVLYTLGARIFIIMNVTPLGCSPAILYYTPTLRKDQYNCTNAWNEFVSLHNEKLGALLKEMQSKYPAAEWILFDAYSLFLDGYHNPSHYGIKYPFQACCGGGGPYNYDSRAVCGEAPKYINGTYIEAKKCKDPRLHLVWDSIHPTESFSRYIAEGVLYGTHLAPNFNITMRVQNA